jgi:hypothetical protein
MVYRVFAVTVIVSTVFFGVTIFLLVVSNCDVDPRQDMVSMTRDCHVTVADGRIVFFSNTESGPYRGSVVQFSDDKGSAYPPIKRTEFGDTWGIYYRHLRWLDSGVVVWTMAISLAYPLMAFAILPVTWGWRRWRHRRRPPNRLSDGAQP